jgi:hypothetical protein
MKVGEFIDQLSDYQLLKNTALWRQDRYRRVSLLSKTCLKGEGERIFYLEPQNKV